MLFWYVCTFLCSAPIVAWGWCVINVVFVTILWVEHGVDPFFLAFKVLFGVCSDTWDKARDWVGSTVLVRWY